MVQTEVGTVTGQPHERTLGDLHDSMIAGHCISGQHFQSLHGTSMQLQIYGPNAIQSSTSSRLAEYFSSCRDDIETLPSVHLLPALRFVVVDASDLYSSDWLIGPNGAEKYIRISYFRLSFQGYWRLGIISKCLRWYYAGYYLPFHQESVYGIRVYLDIASRVAFHSSSAAFCGSMVFAFSVSSLPIMSAMVSIWHSMIVGPFERDVGA